MVSTAVSTRFLASALLALLVAFVAVPRGAQSFAPSYNKCSSIGYHDSVLSSTPSEDDTSLGESSEVDETPPPPAVKCPDCDLCDGSGRIEGGIGKILTFWPIKAYRPCPNFIENGGFYTRSGQGLDEIAFGRDSKYNPMDQ